MDAAVEPGTTLSGSERPAARTRAVSYVRADAFVLCAAALYGLVFSGAAWLSFRAYREPRFDLGNMVQAVWATAHGHPLRVSTPAGMEVSRLGSHVDPFLVLLTPFWWLWSSPLVLLTVQAFAVSAGAIPVYWLARKHLRNTRLAATFSIVYLLYAPTQFNAFTPVGVHAVSFAIPLILFAIWYLDEERILPFTIFALLAASTKEEIAVAVGCLGVWYAVRRGHRLIGSSIFVAGLVLTLVDVVVVIPHFTQSGISPFAGRYRDIGATPGGMLHTATTDPVAFINAIGSWHKLGFVALLLVPLLGLWIFEPLLLLGAAPDLAINLLSSKPEQTTIFYQYTAGIIPFVIAASILGAGRMRSNPKNASRAVLAVLGVTGCLAFVSPLFFAGAGVSLAKASNPVHAATAQALSLIPNDARVSASQTLGGYLSERRFISVFPNVRNTEWVIVGPMAVGYDDPRQVTSALARLEASPTWRVLYASHGITVLRRR